MIDSINFKKFPNAILEAFPAQGKTLTCPLRCYAKSVLKYIAPCICHGYICHAFG